MIKKIKFIFLYLSVFVVLFSWYYYVSLTQRENGKRYNELMKIVEKENAK